MWFAPHTSYLPGAEGSVGSRIFSPRAVPPGGLLGLLQLPQQSCATSGWVQGGKFFLLHPPGLPVSSLPPTPLGVEGKGVRARLSCCSWAEKLHFYAWERGRCSPGAAATALNVAFWLLEDDNSFAFLSWTNVSRALPHSAHLLCSGGSFC